jgi:hypothetical protein
MPATTEVQVVSAPTESTRVTLTLPCAITPAVQTDPGSSVSTCVAVGAAEVERWRAAAIATALPVEDTPALFVAV